MGGYGFIRYSLPLFPHASVYFAPLVFTLSILAVVYASFTTLRQTDLKRVIAYSSVSHMGVVCLGIFSLSLIGLEGSIFLQIAHGLVSSALFIIVTILYDRYHTRLIKYYRGMTILMPLFSFFFFFFTLANIGVPLSCNFIGEFTCLLALFEAGGLIIALFSALGIILSASYALFLYNRVAFGQFSLYANLSISHRDALRARDEAPISPDISQASSSRESIQKTSFNNALDVVNRDLDRKEFFVLLPLGFFTLLLGIFPNLVFDMLHASVTQIVAYL